MFDRTVFSSAVLHAHFKSSHSQDVHLFLAHANARTNWSLFPFDEQVSFPAISQTSVFSMKDTFLKEWLLGDLQDQQGTFPRELPSPVVSQSRYFHKLLKRLGREQACIRCRCVAHNFCWINMDLWDDLICQMTNAFCSLLIGGRNMGAQEVSILSSF